MSHLSDIGFEVKTQEDFKQLIEKAYKLGKMTDAKNGKYSLYSDSSGAELWIQLTEKNELIGANPHYKGKSKRKVCLMSSLQGQESELDGSFQAWADPQEENNPDTGAYPFIFDVPDFFTLEKIDYPKTIHIQLSAFARELDYYESEKAYSENQTGEPKFASKSFIPSGLFVQEGELPQAFGLFAGMIKEYSKKTNDLTKQEFYWFLVDTLGGEVDLLADPKFIKEEPQIGGVIHGQFWLSGRLIAN